MNTNVSAQAGAGLPAIEVNVCKPERREPGLVIFPVNKATAERPMPHDGVLIGIGRSGEVAWSVETGAGIGGIWHTRRNTILLTSRGRILELDMSGDTVGAWTSRSLDGAPGEAEGIPLDVGVVHHSTIELPSGNLLSLGTAWTHVDAYPTSETDADAPRAPADVKEDVIIEFTRAGDIVRRHNLGRILDTGRIGYYSVVSGELGPTPGGDLDWSHSNGLFYDPSDDSYLISIRHQDAIAKIGLADGELKWILGDPAGWSAPWSGKLLQPASEIEWQYHQHDPSLTSDGCVLCFDNGNCRAVPYAPRRAPHETYSRAVAFRIDEGAGTVTEAWSFAGPPGETIYSSSQGGAVELPETGNIFCNFSCIRTDRDGNPAEDNLDSRRHIRLFEVTRDADPEIVLDITIPVNRETGTSYSSFRSIHVPEAPAGYPA